jgi:lysine 2,3-aminomutase
MDKLRGWTSGLAIPYYVIDAPGGGGKIPMLPNYVVSHDENTWVLRNYKYDIYSYPDVVEEKPKAPAKKRPIRAPRKKKIFADKKEKM